MKTPITEFETQNLLEQGSRRANAKAVLAKSAASRTSLLASAIATGVAVYFMGDFAAPLAVKVLISVGFASAILSQIECWHLQRRLDAAIELLRQAESRRG
ncbi:hypothetical protein GCM10027277_23860 [Pseudoduganella ginsengisoli]|uniref:DUF202 domain-containing protein n=1 Tax=Pseudoduganella ginsengisoli TaxID=1462440 RepID=A0A6L6Q0M5_9BURK|nr:hypothetical protein [Pseudoduganella ginsengisoli]MTW02891.1 hypothetical protein [Pseudoduganella ginsengisoli]